MSYLLDTCILSKLRKIQKKPDKILQDWISKHSEGSYYISVLTIGEIQLGINKLNTKNNDDLNKKLVLEDWLISELIPRFNGRILIIDLDIATTWGKISGRKPKKGDKHTGSGWPTRINSNCSQYYSRNRKCR